MKGVMQHPSGPEVDDVLGFLAILYLGVVHDVEHVEKIRLTLV